MNTGEVTKPHARRPIPTRVPVRHDMALGRGARLAAGLPELHIQDPPLPPGPHLRL